MSSQGYYYQLTIIMEFNNITYSFLKKNDPQSPYGIIINNQFKEEIKIESWDGISDKKYYAIDLGLDLFKRTFDQVLDFDNIKVQTLDFTNYYEQYGLNSSETDSDSLSDSYDLGPPFDEDDLPSSIEDWRDWPF